MYNIIFILYTRFLIIISNNTNNYLLLTHKMLEYYVFFIKGYPLHFIILQSEH